MSIALDFSAIRKKNKEIKNALQEAKLKRQNMMVKIDEENVVVDKQPVKFERFKTQLSKKNIPDNRLKAQQANIPRNQSQKKLLQLRKLVNNYQLSESGMTSYL